MDYQDVLAELGAASAHPGGGGTTKVWRRAVCCGPGQCVLDVGCGTGKSLIDLCADSGCDGVGVDIRPKMVEKAARRAQQRAVANVAFLVASATRLPFTDAQFDGAFSESVNVFLEDPLAALREVRRVLRPGGWYVDVEMLVLQPVDATWRAGVRRVYGAKNVPDQRGWRQLYKEAGFDSVQVLRTQSVHPFAGMEPPAGEDPDLVSPGAYERPEVLAALRANADWLATQHGPLGFGIFLCRKS
ncbi:MAG: methyltransferase domain-containing protein [Alicyclobacillus sp.]|nr:methyltransferase domain-containing protein [Alicyclobacillus sp.]